MAYVDSTTASGTSSAPAVAVPTGVQADDIVILALQTDSTSSVINPGDFPTGFTELVEVDVTNDGQTNWVAWKRLTGADSGSYTIANTNNADNWILQAIAFRGRHTTDPPVLASATNNSGNSSPVSVDAPTVTALAGDDLLVISAPDVNTNDAGNGHTAPANYTEQEDAEAGFNNLALFIRENVSAGATGTISPSFAMTGGTAGWFAAQVRIPAAAGGGGGGGRRNYGGIRCGGMLGNGSIRA
jgi:hypothetical protein